MTLRVSSIDVLSPPKYCGLVAASGRNVTKADEVGSVYFARMHMRPFAPLAGIGLHSPIRRQAWSIPAKVFNYRSVQKSGALEPRGGPRSSRKGEFCDGALYLVWHRLDDFPVDMRIMGRIAW